MNWEQLKQILASGDHHYDPELLERSPLGLKKYAAIARDFRFHNARHARTMRCRTHDNTPPSTALTFRMGAGIPGDVNRYHPFSIEPCLIDAAAPPLLYGQAVLIDPTTQGVRPLVAGDQALTDIFGVTVRPFPLQQSSGGMSSALGNVAPPTTGVIDVLKNGYIKIGFNVSGSAPVKNGQVYVWTAATSGVHIQGGWETANPAGNGMAVSAPNRTYYQGGWDASNFGELVFHV
jgi:hypothetical protein